MLLCVTFPTVCLQVQVQLYNYNSRSVFRSVWYKLTLTESDSGFLKQTLTEKASTLFKCVNGNRQRKHELYWVFKYVNYINASLIFYRRTANLYALLGSLNLLYWTEQDFCPQSKINYHKVESIIFHHQNLGSGVWGTLTKHFDLSNKG